MTVRVLIADDHSMVRQGLQMFLELDPEIVVTGFAKTGIEALNLVRQLKPDVVLMDLQMPEMDGLVATEAIRSELPKITVLVLTSTLEETVIAKTLEAGANGYLLKDSEADICLPISS